MAVQRALNKGLEVSHVHLRYVNPLPADLKDIASQYERILVPEVNSGQLALLLRAHLSRDLDQLNKVRGEPFKASEIEEKITELLA